MQDKKDIVKLKTDNIGNKYINSYDKEKGKEINIFFDEKEDKNVIDNVINLLAKIYAENIISNKNYYSHI